MSSYSGNILVVTATTSTVIALTWGGIQFEWTSAHIIVPLVLGLVGLACFFAFEAIVPKSPIVRLSYWFANIYILTRYTI